MPITKATASSIAPAAKGDLVVGSATNDAVVLSTGTTGQVLTVDSSTTSGLKWATPSSGGMTLLSTTSLTGASVTISTISQDYIKLYIIIDDYYFATADQLAVQVNADSSSNSHYYCYSQVAGSTGSADGGRSTAGRLQSATGTTLDGLCQTILTFNNYTQVGGKIGEFTSFYQAASSTIYGQDGFVGYTDPNAGWSSTAAITSLKFLTVSGNNFSGGTVKIYGVK